MLDVFISGLGLGLRSFLVEVKVRVNGAVNGVHVVHVVKVHQVQFFISESREELFPWPGSICGLGGGSG